MSDAQDGAIQALERKIEKRLSIIEKRQDDLDLVVVDQAAMSFRLKAERDDARAAAQVQADEIARLKAEHAAELVLSRAETTDWRERNAESTTMLITADREIARMTAELQRAHEAGERLQSEVVAERESRDGVRKLLEIANRRHEADLAAAVKRADATTAKLGRAVAALESIRANMVDETPANRDWIAATKLTIDDTVDADSAAAGEAYSNGQEALRLLSVYHGAGSAWRESVEQLLDKAGLGRCRFEYLDGARCHRLSANGCPVHPRGS